MSAPARERRGRPLAVFGIVMVAWVAMRATVWESPFGAAPGIAESASPALPRQPLRLAGADSLVAEGNVAVSQAVQSGGPRRLSLPVTRQSAPAEIMQSPGSNPILAGPTASPIPVTASTQARLSAAPQSVLPIRDEVAQNRWSLDAWVYLRQGSGAAAAPAGRTASYGASQAGGVLRYRLAPESSHDPRAFVRAYRALVDRGESEIAVGLSARPVPSIPLRAHVELRATDRPSGVRQAIALRPAAYVTTELAPLALPRRIVAEGYAQAGYVAGEGATGFVDGQAAATRAVGETAVGTVRLGAGTWGGAQEGSWRLDAGPTARLDLAIGGARARVSLDYRARLAGDAAPGSGVALTVSAGF